jgi:hypothetical protein
VYPPGDAFIVRGLVYNAHENQQTITFMVNGKTQNHTIRGLGFETITLT